jgi:hypothetical protein
MVMGVRVVKFATSKNLIIKSKMFPDCIAHKCTWSFLDGKTHNCIDLVMMDERQNSNIVAFRSFRGVDCDIDHF